MAEGACDYCTLSGTCTKSRWAVMAWEACDYRALSGTAAGKGPSVVHRGRGGPIHNTLASCHRLGRRQSVSIRYTV